MKWFNNLKIRFKLLLAFSVLGIITAYISFVGITEIHQLDDSDTQLYENMTVPLADILQVKGAFDDVMINLRDMITADSQEQISLRAAAISEYRKTVQARTESFEKKILSDEVRTAYNEFVEARKVLLPLLDQVIALAQADDDSSAFALLNGTFKQASDIEGQTINKLVELKLDHAKAKSAANTELATSAGNTMLFLLLLGITLAVSVSLFISNYISKQISAVVQRFDSIEKVCLTNLSRGTDELARGNLNISIKTGTQPLEVRSKDEFGVLALSVNQIIKKTHDTIASVENAAATIRDMVEQTKYLVDSALKGRLSDRGNASRFEGGFREVIDGLNQTFEAVVKPINESGKILDVLAKGDLTVRMSGEYNGDYMLIKDSINMLAESMETALGEVNEAVQATASASGEISSSTEQMASGAQEQTQQATEIAGAVEEMTKTIYESTKNITDAAAMSLKSSETAEKGAKKVEQTRDGMNKIVRSADETGRIISTLAVKTDQIGEIAQVINDIADQTNLLALNAAIEAARAGEQGRGFAVVADEVRKLAERTTKATKEIAETIRDIQNEAKGAETSMNEARAAVEYGMKLTEEVSEVLSEMLKGTKKVNDVVSQVAAASEEQSATAEQISKNIEGISSVTQQSAAGTEQIARAAEDLNRLTLNLQELISRFRVRTSSHIQKSSYSVKQNGRLTDHRNKLLS